MRETIILTSLNGSELLRMLARYGRNTFNVRVFNSAELAKEALIRSGITIESNPVSEIRQACIIKNIFSDIAYFKESTFMDAVHFVKSYASARKLCRGNEVEKLTEVFSKGEFPDKNSAILEVIRKYQKYLNDNRLADTFIIINKAIAEACAVDADFVVFEEDKPEPLEEELLNRLSMSSFKRMTIAEFANKKTSELKGISYDDGYGSTNEIEHIMSFIAKENFAYDDCLIAVADDSLNSHILRYRDINNISLSFGNGQNLLSSNAAKILSYLYRWTEDYFSKDSLVNLLNLEEFDTKCFWKNVAGEIPGDYDRNCILEIAGNLRLENTYNEKKLSEYNSVIDDKEEKYYETVEKIARELSLDISEFLMRYTKTYDITSEAVQLKKIADILNEYKNCIDEYRLSDILKAIINQKSSKELSRFGSIHVTDLTGALSTIRKHVFIAGLGACNFPGSPSEDYLLLDSDLELFNEPDAKDSAAIIANNKKLFIDLVKTANNFGSDIHLSYSGYNLSELKTENPSSMLFEVFRLEHGESASMKDLTEAIGAQHSYFDSGISVNSGIGRSYLNGIDVKPAAKEEDDFKSTDIASALSPTQLEVFFECPKRFYLKTILKLDEEETDDPFVEMPARYLGDLFHECMEEINRNPSITRKEMTDKARKKADDFFKKRVPVHTKRVETLKNSFEEIVGNGYDIEKTVNAETICIEHKFKPVMHALSSLKLKGKADKVEKNNSGDYVVVDYKTGRKQKHEEDDIATCMQILIYAYLYEKESGNNVKEGIYRYPRLKRSISCINNDAIKEQFDSRLLEIRNALDSGVFPCTENTDNCKYCTYSLVCGKLQNIEVEENDD